MDYARSRKSGHWESDRSSSPDRRNFRATQLNDSNDIGFDWINGESDWRATQRNDLGATRRDDLGATRRDDLGATRRNDLGATRRDDLGATRRDDLGATRRDDLGATRRNDLGATRRDDIGATRRVDLGATGDTRREAFGASDVDRLRATSPYRETIQEDTLPPCNRDIVASKIYRESRGNPEPFRETSAPGLESYDYAVEENKYEVRDGQDSGPRRWTSLAADKNLMEEWHSMFGQIRKKWTPAPSSRLDDDMTISKWSADQSSSYSDQRRRNKRAIIVLIAIVAVALLVAAIVPAVVLTLDKEKDGEVFFQYEFQVRIENKNYDPNMADSNSDEFKEVENEFCSQLDRNALDSNMSEDFNNEGCAVTEIKSGSLIINFVIVIRTANKAPTASVVSAFVGIQISDADQSVASFLIVNVDIITETPKVITADESPVKKAIQFNDPCEDAQKQRCVTKHSKCLEAVCKCPLERTHNATIDSCTLIDCSVELAIANGTVTSNGTQYGSVLNISCADGFELSNDTDIICTSPSSWLELPECIAVECVEFIKPNNSEINTNSSGHVYTDVIEITCDTGYQLDRNISLVECLANRSWSDSPTCSIVKCTLFESPDNAAITPDNQSFDYNTSTTVDCDPGYDILGEPIVICLSNGSWSDVPKCVPLDCDPLKIAGAVFKPNGQPYRYLDNVTVDCNDGFSIEGDQFVRCSANGSWLELPSCVPLDCDPLKIAEAVFKPNEQPYRYLDNVTVDCNDGYTIEGSQFVSCSANGSWLELPSCVPLDCDPLKIAEAVFKPNEQPFRYLDNVTVDCNDGFSIEGDQFVSCSSNGSWLEFPSCVPLDCDPLDISDAIFKPNKTQYIYGENVTVSCDVGFELKGTEMISCQRDRSWKGTPICDAIVCKLFELPENVQIIGEAIEPFSYGKNVSLKCKNGYNINGNSMVKCQENKSWTAIPTCIPISCDDFQLPTRAINNSRIKDLSFDDTVYITCESGFILVGNSNVSCKIDGTWPTFSCVEANCSADDFLQPNNSKVSNTTESGTIFEFECIKGYTLVGNSSVSCISGNWSKFPTCEVINCGPYGSIENGNVSFQAGTKFEDTVDIICNANFKLIGESQGICLQNGSWSEKPICQQLRCENFVVPENTLIPDNMNKTAVGTNVSLSCMDGYYLVGADTVVCQYNETWSEIPSCALEDCDQPEKIDNSIWIGFDTTTFNSTFNVKCQDGYDLKGNSMVECQANGSWTEYPVCEIKDCGEIGELGNGTIFNQTGTSFGSIAYTKCNDGFGLVGRENVTCLANGKWDALPICKETDCGDYYPPEHAIIGPNSEINCDEGYELFGDEKIECLNGDWSGNGTCERVQCGSLPEIDNSDITTDTRNTYFFGDKVNVTCKNGFELSSNMKAECDENKTWINVPSCNAVSCGEFPFPPNSEISTVNAGVFEDILNITCLNGFDLEGDNNVICNASGKWENNPICKPKPCSRFEIPEHSRVPNDTNLDGFTYNQSIIVTCNDGYVISGNDMITCGSNGEWDSSPSCLPVNCSTFTLPKNAILAEQPENSYTYKDNVQINCLEGYTLNGSEKVECLSNGDWSDLPTCVPKDCGMHEPVSNTYEVDINGPTTFNSSLTVKCKDGLELTSNSDQSVNCGSDGKWHGTPNCDIPGSVSFTHYWSNFLESGDGTISCEVSGNSQWQTVLLAKATPGENSPIYTISNTNGFVEYTNLDDNYTVNYNQKDDGVSISLEFLSVACENEGVYTCAVIVGDKENATKAKFANATVNVSCIDCGMHKPISNTYEVDANGSKNFNSSLEVTCIDGLELTDDSDKVVTCGSDGKWHGIPDCKIPGSVSITQDPLEFLVDENGTLRCEVSGNPRWQTVLLAKVTPSTGENSPIFSISNATGSVEFENLDDNYSTSYNIEDDGVSISLDFHPVTCDNTGVYTCAVIVGKVENATEAIFANATVDVSCIDCGLHKPIDNTYEVEANGSTTFNSSLTVTCIDGLELTDDSDKVLTCGSDGNWHGTPNCKIPGSVSFTQDPLEFSLDENGTLRCEVSGNPQWQTVLLAKVTPSTGENSPIFSISNATGSVEFKNLDDKYSASYYTEDDGVSISLDFHPVTCDNTGVYTCAVIVGKVENATEAIFANATVDVSCIDCGLHKPIDNTYEVEANGSTTFNSSLTVTCIDGLELKDDSDKVLTCGSDGNWHGTPDCKIPGSVSFTQDPLEFSLDENGTLRCEVSGNPQWQTVLLAKVTPSTGENFPIYSISNATGSVEFNNLDDKYSASYYTDDDGVSISLDFHPVTCINTGVYTCAVIVGKVENATEVIFANATVNVSCIDCGLHKYIDNTYEVDASGSTTFNSSLTVTCIDGLELTDDSEKVVTCGSDGKWHGTPDCKIPGSVSFTQDQLELSVDENGTLRCEVSGNPQWQTVLLAKVTPSTGETSPIISISNTTGSVELKALDDNYYANYSIEGDDVSITLNFFPVTCESKGDFTCAVIVGEVENATEAIFANASVNVTCIDCGIHKPIDNTYEIDANGSTTFNSSLTVTCIHGLELTDDSDEVLTCGTDGKWHGTPDCKIPGSLSFTKRSYAAKDGTALNVTCNVTDYPNWQTLMLFKVQGEMEDSAMQLFMMSNMSGTFNHRQMNESYNVSFDLREKGATITLELDPVQCENKGQYTCAAIVGDPENAIESKVAVTQLNVSSDSERPEIMIPEKIYFGKEAKVKCIGLIGKGSSGEKEGQLHLESNFGENGESLIYNTTDNSEDIGCFLRESISLLIPTSTDAENMWAQCIIQSKQGDAIFSEKKNITVSKSFVAFENSTYIFNIGEKSAFTCIVNGIPEWKRVEIKRSDGKVILGVNSTDQIPDSYESHVRLISNESIFSNDSATVAVIFDAVNCNDTTDGFGDVQYICAVETSNSTLEDEATITFQRRPQEPVLKMSREIIENKFTLGDRMFSCEGEVGFPPGSIEIQSNYNGTFETFLSLMPGRDNNTIGWIVNNETDTSDCKHYKKLNFAFHNVTKDWQYKRLRCVIHPSNELLEKTDDLYDEKSINIIPVDICVGESGFIKHPYFCDLIVECSRSVDGQIIGVPEGCKENMCYKDENHCVECSLIGGCNITTVKCDKTSASVKMGDTVSFTCNIQDFGEVTYISVNDEVESEINGTETEMSIIVSNGVDATINEAHVILRFSNVSCDQSGDYLINLNNDTEVRLTLGVISDAEEPFIYVPHVMTANEATAINCSGKIGRDVVGNGIAPIYLEVQFEDASNYTIVDADAARQTEDKNCEISEKVVFQFTPDVAWNNSVVRCTAKNDDLAEPLYSLREHISLDTPGLFCNPMLLGAQSGETVTFKCDLKDVEKITSLSISKNETIFINESNTLTLPYEEGAEDSPFTVSIASLKQLTVSFTSIECEQEGDYSITINDELSVTLTLRVLAPAIKPNIIGVPKMPPNLARMYERIEIACSGEVGRDLDGNVLTDIYIEVKFEMESEFSNYNGSIEKESANIEKCVFTQEARLILYPDIAWNNSQIRCVSRNKTNIVETSEFKELIVYSPNVYFENTTLTGILGESVVLTCIMRNMYNLTDISIVKGEERKVIASHKGGSNLDYITVLSSEVDGEGSSGSLEINVTLRCGDDGKYYCHPNSSDTPSEAVSVITTEWKAETPILDPSSDMVENNEPWAGYGYETTCKGELGTFQDATLHLETNLYGVFTEITDVKRQQPVKDLEKCTNIATITFHNNFTSEWNGTILRCVIDTEDKRLIDAEYVQVVPDTYCDNISANTRLPHPFDCRGIFTCGGARKLTALRLGDCDLDECYKSLTDSTCIPCADVDKCRLDPLDGSQLEETYFKIITKDNGEWWHFDGNNPTLKRVSSIHQVEDDFVKFTFEKQMDGSFKIKSVAMPIYMYDGYEATNATTEDLFGSEDNPDDDHMRFIFTKVSGNYYRIQTKATGRYVRLEDSKHVSSKSNIKDDRSLFQFLDVSSP